MQAAVVSQVKVPVQVAPVVSVVFAIVTLHEPSVPQFRHWGQLDCVQQTPSRQLPEAHSVPLPHVSPGFFLHAPEPSHVFVPMQVVPVASSAFATVMLHAPLAPQFWHCGQLDCVQQTSSRQLPEAHSVPVVQVAPPVFMKVAVTDLAASAVTEQPPGPLHEPDHPVKIDVASGFALNVTTVPMLKLAPQVVPQAMPEGDEITVPPPVPLLLALTVYWITSKLAVTAFAALIVTKQLPVPLHAPDQPVKVEVASATAVSVTPAPMVKLAAHVLPQLMPAGDEVTVPPPVPVLPTVRPNWIRSKLAVTDFAASAVTRHVPVPLHDPDQPVNVEVPSAAAVSVTCVPLVKL